MNEVGQVLEIVHDTTRAVFLRVQLRNRGIEALVRWCSQQHGAGWGSWWVPPIGADVLCMFTGAGHDGVVDDIDEGFAVAVISTKFEPPVPGLKGPLSLERRVFKGRPGEAQDDHYAGAHDLQVDGPQTQNFLATRDLVVEGDETRHFKATRTATVDGDETRTNKANVVLTIEGDAERTVEGAETRTNEGALTVECQDDVTVTIAGAETRETTGTFDRLWQAAATLIGNALVKLISSAEIQIAAPVVRLGAEAAAKRVVHEDFIPLYNSHAHYVPFATGPGDTHGPVLPLTAGPGVTSTKAVVDN